MNRRIGKTQRTQITQRSVSGAPTKKPAMSQSYGLIVINLRSENRPPSSRRTTQNNGYDDPHHDHAETNACRSYASRNRAAAAGIAGCLPRTDHRRHDPGEQPRFRQFLLAAGPRRRTDDLASNRLVSRQMVGGGERMDSHGPDFSLLPVYCRRVHGVLVCRAARAWRLTLDSHTARGAAERADPADRLRYPHPAVCQFLPHALPRSLAAHRHRVSFRVRGYAVDLNPRPHSLDRRTARRLLCADAVRSCSGMRSCRLVYADADATLHAGRIH